VHGGEIRVDRTRILTDALDVPRGNAAEITAEVVPRVIDAEGEALLGWLNATVQFWSQAPFDGNAILSQLAIDLQHRLNTEGAEVAHLKMTLDPENGFGDLGVINLVRNDYAPELSQNLSDPMQRGELIINMRAEVAPELLGQLLASALEHCARKNRGLDMKVQHQEHFRPGKPTPTFRLRAFA